MPMESIFTFEKNNIERGHKPLIDPGASSRLPKGASSLRREAPSVRQVVSAIATRDMKLEEAILLIPGDLAIAPKELFLHASCSNIFWWYSVFPQEKLSVRWQRDDDRLKIFPVIEQYKGTVLRQGSRLILIPAG